MNFVNRIIFLACLLAFTTSLPQALAEEELTLFRADIEIKENRKIRITETLKITVEGVKVRQGIVRALRLKMEFPDAIDQNLTYEIQTVLRNGKPAKYNSLVKDDLLILQIYERGIFLDHAEHTFQITYTVSGYNFDAEMFDTFNWHVTGSGWPLPINLAEAYIKFPPMVLPQNVVSSGYTVKEDDNVISRTRGDRVHFTTLDPLTGGKGFSISATWAKGFFKGSALLSVPGIPRHREEINLLSVPEDNESSEIPTVKNTIKVDSLNPEFFTPTSISRYFMDVHVNTDRSITVSESIIAIYGHASHVQGLIRNRPLAIDSISTEFAFGGSSQLTISKDNQRYFLVAPSPLSGDTHSFTFQYKTPKIVKIGKQYDSLKIVLGDPALQVPIKQVGARIHPPEYMLPNADLVTATIVTGNGQAVATATISEKNNEMIVSSERGLAEGQKMILEFRIPKGFLKD